MASIITHHFAPAKPQQQKVVFDCHLPHSHSHIKKVTTALPFPTDLSKALDFSAAYVEHAAHLADHAHQQFNNLQKDHEALHKTSNAQLDKIKDLEHRNRHLDQNYNGLQAKYNALEAHHRSDVKDANAREKKLNEQLKAAQAAASALEKKVKQLEEHIDEDKLEDLKRNQDYKDHISQDHLRIVEAEESLAKAEVEIKTLKENIEATNKKLAVADATIKTLQEQLAASVGENKKLTDELAAEKQAKNKLQDELTAAKKQFDDATIENSKLAAENSAKRDLIQEKYKEIDERDALILAQGNTIESNNALIKVLRAPKEDKHEAELKVLKDEITRLTAELKAKTLKTDEESKTLKATIAKLEADLKAKSATPLKTDAVATVTEIH